MIEHDGTRARPGRLASGVAGLDTVLGGGFITGGIYILRGTPGAGKTILTNQICFHQAASGGRATFVTLLAENHARMLDNMRTMSFFDEALIPDRLVYLSAFAEMRHGGLEALTQLLRREVQRNRTTVLIADGLVSARTSSESDSAFKEFVHGLQEIALATGCTMFLTTNGDDETSPEQTMVDGIVVLADRMYGWQSQSDLQVTKFRGSGFLRGRHSYKIDDSGLGVFPRIEALYAMPGRPAAGADATARVTTGCARLDEMLFGGLPADSTTMLMGPSGVGKTTLGLQFLAESSAAEPGLMFGFYETPARIRNKADRIRPSLGRKLDDGVVEMLWQTPTSDLLDAYGARLLDAVRRRRIKRLFIDGLSAFQNSAIDASRIGNFFSALANELRVSGVTTVYSLEVPNVFGTSVRVPVDDASSLAENMVVMRYVEKRTRLHRIVSVLKVRDSDFDPQSYEFVIGPSGLDIAATMDGAEATASDDADPPDLDRAAGADSSHGRRPGR